MAESSDTGSGGSWWGGWLQAAKEKSLSAIEMIKKDLEEFSNTMQNDTGEAVAKTSESLRETLKTENTEAARDKLKQGISSFLDGLTKLLVVEAEDRNLPVVEKRKTTDPIFDRAKARLHAIQVDPSTYCDTPSGPIEKFEEWVKSFNTDSKKGEISELLVSQVEVRGLYTRLVPSEISHADFWKRYFYKVHQLQIDEARKLALMKRAEQSEKKEDSINWDDEDSSGEEEEKKSSLKSKTENNRLPTIPQDSEESKNKTSVTKTETDILPKTESETKQNTETSPDNKSAPTQNDSHIGDTHISSANTEDKQTGETICESASDIQTDTKLNSDKTCTNNETSEIKDNSELVNMENKEDNLDTADSQVETKSTSEDSEKLDKNVKKCDKTETEPSVESEIDTAKQPPATENETKPMDEIKTKIKGDTVVVNPDRESPSTESTKGSADDDWERDFDVELTEEDLKAADEIAKKLNLSSTDYTKLSAEMDDDWESWE